MSPTLRTILGVASALEVTAGDDRIAGTEIFHSRAVKPVQPLLPPCRRHLDKAPSARFGLGQRLVMQENYWRDSTQPLERVAHTEQGSELLKNPTCCVVRSRDNLLPGECGEIIAEFCPEDQVWAQGKLHTASNIEDHLPYIVGDEAGDFRNWLWERLRTGDYVIFCASTSGNKGTPTMVACLEVEKQIQGQRMRIALYIRLDAGSFKEGMPVVIEVAKLHREII
jgi:hypothetical protein